MFKHAAANVSNPFDMFSQQSQCAQSRPCINLMERQKSPHWGPSDTPPGFASAANDSFDGLRCGILIQG
jgi:hypothetical protein